MKVATVVVMKVITVSVAIATACSVRLFEDTMFHDLTTAITGMETCPVTELVRAVVRGLS